MAFALRERAPAAAGGSLRDVDTPSLVVDLDALERNVERDRETDRLLAECGWLSIRVWEHEDPRRAAQRVVRLVRSRRKSPVPLADRICRATD